MPPNRGRIREALKNFDFAKLFIEELGRDRPPTSSIEASVDGATYNLTPAAHKRGMVVFLCAAEGGQIPNHPTRSQIERQATKSVHEHIIIYVDADQETQVWQWVRREPGRPAASRQHSFHRSQPGDALIQKLMTLAFDLAEEEGLTIAAVAGRAKRAFDVDRLTKRFYDRFKAEHADFLSFVEGIQSVGDREWYASVMLNRLMFVYFIQKKGLLDGDSDYLRNRLRMMQEHRGKGQFLSFYRHFLLRLFHEGLGRQARSSELDLLLGSVPYLNGGLFDVHALEVENAALAIADEAFEKVFDFFDAYQWHLDERPLRADNEINPDVLGYIFEKYINQKQMGAYYTKEDITGYMSTNTLIPRLLDMAQAECEIAFAPRSALWQLLAEDPDRYIREPVRRGVDHQLPAEIEKGLDTIAARADWNKAAPSDLALPTETWRELIARRQRYTALHEELSSGDFCSVDELVTNNLDMRQFVQDIIDNAESPDLVRALYNSIERLTVLDPTCGSGAFLFAALSVMEPLYEACLDRMQWFVEEDQLPGKKQRRPDHFNDFRETLAEVARHPNRRYYILKAIIINNLFGVDIMDEAVEICKLRLFLKLVAQIERTENIEPLPDIDFNIRTGNTLVGFGNYHEVKQAIEGDVQARMDLGNDMERVNSSAGSANQAFEHFRDMQTAPGLDAEDLRQAKSDLRQRLGELARELNRYLASEYGVNASNGTNYEKWAATYKPFHWFVEFYGIMSSGGFDVIIGNPPYVEYAQVAATYTVRDDEMSKLGNLHAMVTARCLKLLSKDGAMAMVVPVALPSTNRFVDLRTKLLHDSRVWTSHYDFRPSKLFEGAEQRLTILVRHRASAWSLYSTRFNRWYAEERPHLFGSLLYTDWQEAEPLRPVWPKVPGELGRSVLQKVVSQGRDVASLVAMRGSDSLFYKNTGMLYFTMFTRRAPECFINGVATPSSRETQLKVDGAGTLKTVHAMLNSSLFYVIYQINSNCRDLNPSDIQSFRFPESILGDETLMRLSDRLEENHQQNSEMRVRMQKLTGEVCLQSFKPALSKPILDEIDRVLGAHFGLTDEELDFVINYDVKYRVGADADEARDDVE